MRSKYLRRGVMALSAAGGLAVSMLGSQLGASSAGLSYSLVNVGTYGGEPSITSDSNGILYDTSPSHGTIFQSNDKGLTWSSHTAPDPSSGDNCLATDQSNALYWCNLAGSAEATPLDADVWKSVNQASGPWVHGTNGLVGNGTSCGTSCSPFGVDRQWTAAQIPTGFAPTDTSNAVVVLNYHDFYGPSQIWVNISTNGGATFGAAVNAINGPAFTVNSLTGQITADGFTFCSSVPAGVTIVPPGKPHAGRIIVGWIASDALQAAGGCNITMQQSFHTAFVSYSDNLGASWTPQLAFDGGVGHDMSTPFVGFAADTQGNPYFAFAMNHWDSNAVTNQANIARCATETGATLQGDFACEYDMYVVWSADAGATFTHTGVPSGTIPGSASAPYPVNPASEHGTHFFPAIAALNPGQVDVAYLLTPTIEPIGPNGKVLATGCAGTITGFPPACNWDLYAGQSADLTSPSPTWATANLTAPTPMHIGDICNLGIACAGGRTLLDFIQTTIDPTTGCAHIGYADNNTVNQLRAANETAGVNGACTFAALNASIPEAPWSLLLVPVGVAAAASGGLIARRRRRSAPAA
jgi:hypothetical protein